ncbi:heterokaryon incompatibility protein-domain-containing protein [Cubamyces menziesii]|nr:heterokaryon incompatibility protein-domain-containing protein [Cubamyces menziesii]
MWLLDTHTLELRGFHTLPKTSEGRGEYAILSHVWSPDGEQSFQDVWTLTADRATIRDSPTSDIDSNPLWDDARLSAKLRQCCAVARRFGYRLVWADSCCIDKTSSAELSEAINSMYQWYAGADLCFAFLEDVDDDVNPRREDSAFRRSRWFTRGWTLQELVAPSEVIFLSRRWSVLGSKSSLCDLIEEITGIDSHILLHLRPLSSVSVAQRMSWASRRTTTRVEDEAYSLLGIFGLHMPTIYGEGRNAFRRLQEEIVQRIPDQTLFVWGRSLLWLQQEDDPCISLESLNRMASKRSGFYSKTREANRGSDSIRSQEEVREDLFATSPYDFRYSGRVVPIDGYTAGLSRMIADGRAIRGRGSFIERLVSWFKSRRVQGGENPLPTFDQGVNIRSFGICTRLPIVLLEESQHPQARPRAVQSRAQPACLALLPCRHLDEDCLIALVLSPHPTQPGHYKVRDPSSESFYSLYSFNHSIVLLKLLSPDAASSTSRRRQVLPRFWKQWTMADICISSSVPPESRQDLAIQGPARDRHPLGMFDWSWTAPCRMTVTRRTVEHLRAVGGFELIGRESRFTEEPQIHLGRRDLYSKLTFRTPDPHPFESLSIHASLCYRGLDSSSSIVSARPCHAIHVVVTLGDPRAVMDDVPDMGDCMTEHVDAWPDATKRFSVPGSSVEVILKFQLWRLRPVVYLDTDLDSLYGLDVCIVENSPRGGSSEIPEDFLLPTPTEDVVYYYAS